MKTGNGHGAGMVLAWIAVGAAIAALFGWGIYRSFERAREPIPVVTLPQVSPQWPGGGVGDDVSLESGDVGGFPPGMAPAVPPVNPAKPEWSPNLPSALQDTIPGEYIFSFFNAREQQAFVELARALGVRVLGVLDLGYSVRIATDSRDLLARLLREGPTPVGASVNTYVRVPEPVSPDRLPPESGYFGFGEAALHWLGVPLDNRAWGRGVTVAVLDALVASHPVLREDGVRRISLTGSEGDLPPAVAGHGTAVASLLGGAGEPVRGVVPSAEILSIGVIGEDGVGDAFTLASAIVRAVEEGAGVINLSLGTYGDTPLLRDAVAFAVDRDVLLVAAVGNDGVRSVQYPAGYDGVLAVSAVDAAGRHLYFSNRGEQVDLAAPGIGVVSAWEDDQWSAFSGTSAAAPFVSGAAAWLRGEYPDKTVEEITGMLLAAASDTEAPGPDEKVGAGMLDIARLQTAGTPGIFDAAVGNPYLLPRADGDPDAKVAAFAQNRGTETLPRMDLRVRIGHADYEMGFYDVPPGQTVSHVFRIPEAQVEASGQVKIQCYVYVPGGLDQHPENNGPRTSTLMLAE